MWFWKRKIPQHPPQPKIEVFVRHCLYSSASAHKKRPVDFSREACHQNLLDTLDSRVNVTFFLDTAHPGDHFLKNQAILIKEGTEAGSFLRMLDHVEKLPLHPDTLIYFLEDDYLHRPGWVDVLFEGFSTCADYVTLYDHRDKYMIYPKLTSKIFLTSSCHWRTTPSTTNTYAMRFSTLKKHMAIHRAFSLKRKITADHDKFCALGKKGAMLVSPIPGWATHADPEFGSPFFKEFLCRPSH
jgi:glycosyltransferase involved in cell wall biosynthesis